jgi:hypothetical protein
MQGTIRRKLEACAIYFSNDAYDEGTDKDRDKDRDED